MYSLASRAWPLPERTLADDRAAVQLSAIHEARIVTRRTLDSRFGDQGLLDRVRRAAGLGSAPADCVCPA